MTTGGRKITTTHIRIVKTNLERNATQRKEKNKTPGRHTYAHVLELWHLTDFIYFSAVVLIAHALSASHINQMINLAAVMYDEIKSHHELSEHVVFRRTLCAVGGNEQARKKKQPIGCTSGER